MKRKKSLLCITVTTSILFGCGDAKTSQTMIDSKASSCDQSNQAYEQAAEKFPEFKKEFLQTIQNNRAAVAKFGEAEMADSCKKSAEKIQRMLGK
jgi:hypothetical protein